MAAEDLAGSFQDEVTCSICLEYFTDPVTAECGHNFCRACISQCWGELETNFSCPQCRETTPQRHLRPHRQLGSLAELVKCVRLQVGLEPEGQRVGDRHQEALKLFCEEDQTPLCVVCDQSQAHRTHTVVPMEEAAQEHREQILTCLQRLREEREELLGLKSDWDKESERLPVGALPCPAALHRGVSDSSRGSLRWLGSESFRRLKDFQGHYRETGQGHFYPCRADSTLRCLVYIRNDPTKVSGVRVRLLWAPGVSSHWGQWVYTGSSLCLCLSSTGAGWGETAKH
ncbi:zinc finger protein RFP-like [Dermochelys coriacea]|uniref:zinc finger protein RFP-like n=1 Tax=Dermochelys coriacea TaxID=27794 RepID=UPI001CA9557A|nr:zinc finger protein RFP-like [Dermochelys coriacea]